MKWLRLYDDMLDDPKAQQLPPVLFKHWINLLCLASKTEPRGTLPPVSDVAFRLRLPVAKASAVLRELMSAGLLDQTDETLRPHNWDGRQPVSDNVAERVRKHRANATSNNDETLQERFRNGSDTDTDTDTDTENEGLPTGEAPQAASNPQPTIPESVKVNSASDKPRSDRQRASDDLFHRRTENVHAYFRGLGVDLESLAAKQRATPSFKTLTTAILDTPECSPTVIEPLTRYTAAAFAWRDGNKTPSLAEVLKAYPEWDAAGRPEKPPPRQLRPISGGKPRYDAGGQRLLTSADLRRMAQGETIDEPDRNDRAFIDSAFRVAESARH